MTHFCFAFSLTRTRTAFFFHSLSRWLRNTKEIWRSKMNDVSGVISLAHIYIYVQWPPCALCHFVFTHSTLRCLGICSFRFLNKNLWHVCLYKWMNNNYYKTGLIKLCSSGSSVQIDDSYALTSVFVCCCCRHILNSLVTKEPR